MLVYCNGDFIFSVAFIMILGKNKYKPAAYDTSVLHNGKHKFLIPYNNSCELVMHYVCTQVPFIYLIETALKVLA